MNHEYIRARVPLRKLFIFFICLLFFVNMNDQEQNLKFDGEVVKHKELYNYKLPGYPRKDITEKAWQEVAAKCVYQV